MRQHLARARQVVTEGGPGHLACRGLAKLAAPVADFGRLCFFTFDPFTTPPYRRLFVVRDARSDELRAERAACAPVGDAEMRGRLRRRDQCLVADVGGDCVGSCWVSRAGARLPEIDRDVLLGKDEAYCFDSLVRPEWRGVGVLGCLLGAIIERLRDDGVRRGYFYVRGDNVIGRRKAASWARPAGSIAYVRRRGGRCHVLKLGQLPTLSPPLE